MVPTAVTRGSARGEIGGGGSGIVLPEVEGVSDTSRGEGGSSK